MADYSSWSTEASATTDTEFVPPPVEGVPTYADRTHTVSPAAAGGGSGTDASPWTLAEACQAAQPGMIIGVQAGVYTGTPTGSKLIPAFRSFASGTAEAPIYFVAQYPAALPTTTQYSELRSGGTGWTTGCPAFGVGSNHEYVNWVGFYTDGKAADNWMHEDSGHVTLWSCSYSSIAYCRIIGDPSKISTIPPGNNITNQSGIRTENTLGCLISDCYLADFLTTKVNAAGVLSYKSRNMTITHCEFHNCQNGFQPKGGYAEDTPLNPGGFTGLRFCYNLIHPTVKFGLRLHSQVSTTPEDYHHYYCNRITSSNNVIELTSTSTGGFGGRNSNDNFYGIQFYNNVLRDNANEGLFWYSSNPYNINPGARDNSWANNIILRANYDWRAYGTPQTHFTPAWVLGMQRNIYSSQGANYASFSDGSLSFSNAQAAGLESDSLFSVDAGLDADARPQPGSPAIGLGRDIHGTFGPVNGVIDAGCYPTGTEAIGIRNG